MTSTEVSFKQDEIKKRRNEEAQQKSREKYDADKAAFEERQRQMQSAAMKVNQLRLNNSNGAKANSRNNKKNNIHVRQVQRQKQIVKDAIRTNKYARFHHEKLVPENQRKFIQSLSYHPIATARQAVVRRKYGSPKTRKKKTNNNNPWKNWNWSRNNAGGRRSRKRSRKRKRTRQRKRKRQRRRRKSKRH